MSNTFSYWVIAAMMVCFTITFSQFLDGITHEIDFNGSRYQWGFLPFFIFFTSIEAIFSRTISRELEGRERWLYHFAEWVTFAVLLKAVIYIVHGFDHLLADLPRWQDNILSFFEGEFFFAFFLVGLTWLIARSSASDLEELNVEATDLQWEFGKLQNNRTLIRKNLANRLLWLGIGMVFLTTLIRLNVLGLGQASNLQAPVINILVYFFLALVLFSQTHYIQLQGQWFWHGAQISSGLLRAWIRYSILLFLGLAIVSLVLPTQYSLGLLETLNYILGVILNVLAFLAQLILLPIAWLLSLAGCTRQTQQDTNLSPVQPTPPFNLAPPQPVPWLEALRSILFWAMFVAIILYAVTQFIRQNPQWVKVFQRLRVFTWFSHLSRWITGLFRGWGKQVSSAVGQLRARFAVRRKVSIARQIQKWINFRQLNSRQQVVFYYLRLIERGGQHGITRRSHETPYQFKKNLEANLPDVREDISGMTEQFLEARYSTHPISPQKTSLVQRFWRNIARSLDRLHPSE